MASRKLHKKKIFDLHDYTSLLDQPAEILVDKPAQFVSRITLNVPENNNRMGHVMRAQILNQLQLNDQDPDVRATIIRGAGKQFCSGQDLPGSRGALPFFTNETDGQIMRNKVDGWFMIMDLAKPVIAQVHGECLGSGMELAAACDIVYVAEDAKIGYPPGRNMGLPDFQIYPWLCGMRNALAIMLLAETMDGPTSVERGFSTGCFKTTDLDQGTLNMALRVVKIPADLLAYNKRSVHRAFEAQGMRTNLRHAVDIEALMFHGPSGSILTRAASQAGGAVQRPPPVPRQQHKGTVAEQRKETAVPSEQAKKTQPIVPTESKSLTALEAIGSDINETLGGSRVNVHLHKALNIHLHSDSEELGDELLSKL
eukprot:CAMPEP_0203750678 /NCGR_PEP_ID=MMETSP0098-20131031/4879_1 /ASSEMBLY_ACC=CAM_ASM_000208 /TAXON_ID=96639 /ORGANISM=" , Strain NY0313808BC1" /LENGTH=368 /DNA_ID=CAMNT_0050640083 /DNA_START=25 /DNA_END=1131 /DNA_ORIENTATION=-